jgi:hypothetical protein
VRPGDILVSVGNIRVEDQDFGVRFRAQFQSQEGAPLQLGVRRNGELLALGGRVRLSERYAPRVDAMPNAPPKAQRIRDGILRGTTDS